MSADLLTVEAPFSKRGITQETSEHFGYGVGTFDPPYQHGHKGEKCHIAPYYDADGNMVAQKLRFSNKDFAFLGDTKTALPFGAHAFPRTGKKIVVTEGEIDALSMSQIQGNKWPVVSIACGADKPFNEDGEKLPMSKIKRYFAQHREYFHGFDEVVLMFDMDEQGRESAKAAAEVLGSRSRIATLPQGYKDANEMLVAGDVKELANAMWRAEKYRPEGIVDLASLRKESQSKVGQGIPYLYPGMNRITYGSRTGELIVIGAGAGAGKTDFLTELIQHFVMEHGQSVGAFFLESTPVELSLRYAGKIASKPFHIPDGPYTQADIDAAWDRIEQAKAKVHLYDSFGVNEWDAIKAKIEYLYHAEGVQRFVLDHLTAFAAADPENERTILEGVMGDMGSLVKKIPISIIVVSHLTTPEKGKSHEEGGHIALRHFKGSRSIGFWAHLAFALERDQQHTDRMTRFTTTVRCVKNRPFGHLIGECFYLRYDPETGRLNECDPPGEPKNYGFKDESPTAPTEGPSDF